MGKKEKKRKSLPGEGGMEVIAMWNERFGWDWREEQLQLSEWNWRGASLCITVEK